MDAVWNHTPILTMVGENAARCQAQLASLRPYREGQAWLLFQGQTEEENPAVIDHLNLTRQNPLIGPNDATFGPRFPDMSKVYEGDQGVLVVQGHDPALADFPEPHVAVTAGVWEAIALNHRGFTLHAWVMTDLEKWVSQHGLTN